MKQLNITLLYYVIFHTNPVLQPPTPNPFALEAFNFNTLHFERPIK